MRTWNGSRMLYEWTRPGTDRDGGIGIEQPLGHCRVGNETAAEVAANRNRGSSKQLVNGGCNWLCVIRRVRDSSDSFIRHGTPRHASGQLIVGSKGTTFNGVVIAAGQLLSHLIEFSLSFPPPLLWCVFILKLEKSSQLCCAYAYHVCIFCRYLACLYR